MEFNLKWLFVSLTVLSIVFTSCNKNDDDDEPEIETPEETKTGMLTVAFDHYVGSSLLSLDDTTATTYRYSTANNEKFNVTKFGYYISNIIIEGDNGVKHIDPMNSSANDDEVKGYYQIIESETSSKELMLSGIPEGNYNKITFTVGVPESGVQQGAQGGVLDAANDNAWFWSWNAGYIGWLIEGQAENSEATSPASNGYALHVGGWKNIDAAEGESVKFMDNTRTITLVFDDNVSIAEGTTPMVQLNCNVLDVFDGVSVDFSSTTRLHAPAAGAPFANTFVDAFEFDHVHATTH